jgi:hypothetical protein
LHDASIEHNKRNTWTGKITIYNASSSNINPASAEIELVALFARKDLVTTSSLWVGVEDPTEDPGYEP